MLQEATQGIIVYFNIASLIFMSIILFSVYFRKMTKGSENKWFIILCFITIATIIDDVLCAIFTPEATSYLIPLWLFYFINTFYFICRAIILPAYTMFIIAKAGALFSFRKKKAKVILTSLPMITAVVLLIINLFTPFLFDRAPGYGYHRLPKLILLYVCASFYLVANVLTIIQLRKCFSLSEFISLMLMAPLQLLAVLVQFVNSNLLVELFATTIAIFIITITIHRPELLFNVELGTYTKHAYLTELKKLVRMNRPVTILFVKIRNFNDIVSYLPYNTLTEIMKSRVDAFYANATQPFRKAQVFYLNGGFFAILADQTTKAEASEYAGILNNIICETVTTDKIEVHLIPQICYFDSPNDISGYEGLFSFIQSFSFLMPAQKEPVDAATITGTENFQITNEIDSILAKAIKNNKFMMYYQPIWSVSQKKFISAEALIRLPDEKFGFVSPELFIAAAEKSGAIYQIGDFIIDDVCRFIASDEFKKSGLEYIEINLAVAQCLQHDLPDKIRACVEKYGISFSQLNLEITEREDIADQAMFDRNICALSEMGMTLSLDDYGTGYSNIQRITAMPLDIVKIDKSFVDRKDDENMQIIIYKTISMMKALEKEIVVEGIEDEDTVNYFTNLDCDFIQGYFFSRPLPEKDFIAFCAAKNVN